MHTDKEARTPPAPLLAAVQASAARIVPDNDQLEAWFRAYASNHARRIAFDLDLIERHTAPSDRILELGAVPLLLTLPLHERGHDVTGVDIDPGRFASTIASFDLSVVQCDIEHEPLPLPSDTWDVAVFNELFEHLRINPIFTLREVRRVLKPGGLLLLSTPNLRSLFGLYNFVFRSRAYSCSADVYAQYAKLEEIGHMGHVREYTVPEVVEFLDHVGFDVESVTFRGGYPGRVGRAAARLLPRLRPFVSYVARAR
ncbi:MAG TPA: class I SAM-dependent methyltransferase [Deltaproteobacteria bacterium]|nr:class I SAM-dependent methyltransferase [Deltaproteobacteria bacterium]